jgi:hypothetical protein
VTYTVGVIVVAGLLVAGIHVFMRYAPAYYFMPVVSPNSVTLVPVPGAKLTRTTVRADGSALTPLTVTSCPAC